MHKQNSNKGFGHQMPDMDLNPIFNDVFDDNNEPLLNEDDSNIG